MLAGWMNRHQQQVIEYLQEEVRVLKELHGNKRLKFTDEQRARLARKGKLLDRAWLNAVATLVTPQTILKWHRMLIGQKHYFPHKTPPSLPG
jgi:putative transposase